MNNNPYSGHVTYPGFGYEVNSKGIIIKDATMRIVEYLEKQRVPFKRGIKDKGFLIERLLAEMYNDVFDIADLDDDNNRLALVAYNAKDGLHELGPIYSRIRDYRLYGINERYNLNLKDFLNMPRHITDRIIEDAKLDIAKTSAIRQKSHNSALKELQKEGYDV